MPRRDDLSDRVERSMVVTLHLRMNPNPGARLFCGRRVTAITLERTEERWVWTGHDGSTMHKLESHERWCAGCQNAKKSRLPGG